MNKKLIFHTIGCDPEFFLVEKDTGRVISAEGIIPGTKDEPHYISDNGHMIQLDNVLAEFGIPPSIDLKSFKANIHFVLDYIKKTYGDRYNIGTMASAELDDEFLQSEQALLFGCDPDWNVWKIEQNPPPKAETANLRSAGGHVHVGLLDHEADLDETIGMVKCLDLCLGVPSVLLDKDDRRKELYGKAGAFRFKPYLAEYRTLSNFWIHNDDLIEFVYKNTSKAFDLYNNSRLPSIQKDSKSIINCINNNDKKLAEKLIKKYKLL